MKILFITYFYYDIYVPILQEMDKQGHDVTLVEDKLFAYSPLFITKNVVKRLIKKCLRFFLQTEKKYWQSVIASHPEIDGFYDVVVCHPGLSFCKYIKKRLMIHNPMIKSCVMIQDSSNYMNYFYNNHLYDNVYTFDYEDAKRYKDVKVLGAYWVPMTPVPIVYDIAMVGSDHDDRFDIIKKIYPQLTGRNLNLFIKIVSRKPSAEKVSYPFVTNCPIPIEEVRSIINSSSCILETDREGQSGLTLRDMWALASGKKLITTNTYIKSSPYYNKEQVRFINRENPVIDIHFLEEKKEFPVGDVFIPQRIDNWVRRLLSFD